MGKLLPYNKHGDITGHNLGQGHDREREGVRWHQMWPQREGQRGRHVPGSDVSRDTEARGAQPISGPQDSVPKVSLPQATSTCRSSNRAISRQVQAGMGVSVSPFLCCEISGQMPVLLQCPGIFQAPVTISTLTSPPITHCFWLTLAQLPALGLPPSPFVFSHYLSKNQILS